MKESTLKYLLRILDAQAAHARRTTGDTIQQAYYLGMKEAINAACSEAYTQGGFIDSDKNGKHFISR